MPNLLEPHQLLAWVRELGKSYSFLDMHVHPFDVLSGDIVYRRNKKVEGVFSRGEAMYHPPVMEEVKENTESRQAPAPDSARAFQLAARFKYLHTGSKVFADQLEMTGLSGALLLPVARVPNRSEEMLEAYAEMFAGETRLHGGCAFPVEVPAQKLTAFFRSARADYGIRAIKIHPNLMGVDPLTQKGHDLIETSLVAAGELGVPVVVHGGGIAALKPQDAAEFGMLTRLETINWSLSSTPVIIAHAGCFDLKGEEVGVALSRLNQLLDKHPNLMADTSSLDPDSLRLLLRKVSHDRLIFGSDALYVSMLTAWLGFLRALCQVSPTPDDDLVRIASVNPASCLGSHRSYAPMS